MSHAEKVIGLTSKMYDTRRFLKEHTLAERYQATTGYCRVLIKDTMTKLESDSELNAALELCKTAKDDGHEELIGWFVAAAVDMIEGKQVEPS